MNVRVWEGLLLLTSAKLEVDDKERERSSPGGSASAMAVTVAA